MDMPTFPSSGSHQVHPDTLDADLLTDQLRALHDDYVEMTNMALAEGRDDHVQQLADRYADEALALLTAGARSLA
jgi:5,10-methenyltetrahydromethanopterin hydrogenase